MKGTLACVNDSTDSNPSNSSSLSVAKVLKELDNLSESMAQSDRRGNDRLRSPIHRSGSEVSEDSSRFDEDGRTIERPYICGG